MDDKEKKEKYIGIIVAVHEEERILKSLLSNWTTEMISGMRCGVAYWYSQPVAVLVSGQGEDKARDACRAMIRRFQPRFVLSAGFCGALQKGIKVGDIVVSRRIYRGVDILEAQGRGEKTLAGVRSWQPSQNALELAKHAGFAYKNLQVEQKRFTSNMRSCWEEITVTASRVISRPNEKKTLGKESGAASVDMESAAVAEIMSVAAIPWLAIRAVSDDVEFNMPMDFNSLKNSEGGIDYTAVLKSALKKPALIPGLVRMGINCQKASDSLCLYLQYLLNDLTGSGRL